ncbi:MAG TPA: hypothetical protein VNQ76_14245, partial [Planctomicrobium sp.]|nr:hypothetical protein [Planctomicrobium sp.]
MPSPGKTNPAEAITEQPLHKAMDETFSLFEDSLHGSQPKLAAREVGRVISVGQGVARVSGLPG